MSLTVGIFGGYCTHTHSLSLPLSLSLIGRCAWLVVYNMALRLPSDLFAFSLYHRRASRGRSVARPSHAASVAAHATTATGAAASAAAGRGLISESSCGGLEDLAQAGW